MDGISSTSSTQVPILLKQQQSGDQSADFGLRDRDTVSERLSNTRELNQRVTELHGSKAKNAQVAALSNAQGWTGRGDGRGSLINVMV